MMKRAAGRRALVHLVLDGRGEFNEATGRYGAPRGYVLCGTRNTTDPRSRAAAEVTCGHCARTMRARGLGGR